MVYIEIAQPERLKPTSLSKLSAFVSFEYDSNLVSIIKSMGTRVYIPDKKTWEIPESAVPMLMSRLHDYDVLLRGEMRHETPESHAQLPSGFVFTTKPYKHQMEGVIYGLEHESFLLGDDQGLGKTKEIIEIIRIKMYLYSFLAFSLTLTFGFGCFTSSFFSLVTTSSFNSS